jgi:hypothetical protein
LAEGQYLLFDVEFELLTEVINKEYFLLGCNGMSSVEIILRFGAKYCLRLQGRSVSQECEHLQAAPLASEKLNERGMRFPSVPVSNFV